MKYTNFKSLAINSAICLLAFSISACAGEKSANSQKVSTFDYNAFFETFVFKPQECKAGYPRYYTFANVWDMSRMASDSEYYLNMELFLLREGNYVARLSKMKDDPKYGPNTKQTVLSIQRRGKWAVVGDHLELENLGVGRATFSGKDKVIEFMVTNPSEDIFKDSVANLELTESSYVDKELEVPCSGN